VLVLTAGAAALRTVAARAERATVLNIAKLFVVEEEGSLLQPKTKNCIQPAAAPGQT
jgi:hypothetical protein